MEWRQLAEKAKQLGYGDIGFCSTEDFAIQKRNVEEQTPLPERRQLRFFPQEDYKWASALIVLLWPYQPSALSKSEGDVFVDSYYFASNAAYHAAKELEIWIVQQGYRAKANVAYPAKEAAVRAGLGEIGHHSLLIHPEFGTRTVIILVATDAVTAGQSDHKCGPNCTKCMKCAKACPAGAIDAEGMSHPEKCLRNYMMEGIVVPETIRAKMGKRLIGCDNCQRVCPMQPISQEQKVNRFMLDDFMTTDETAFKQAIDRLAQQIGRNAARPQRVRAQAALLAGNRRNPADIPVLRAWAESGFEAVSVHARWALERMHTSSEILDQNDEKR